MINLHITRDDSLLGTLNKDSKAYKTYYNFATGKATPKKARKKPAKKSTTVPTACVVIIDTLCETVSKKKAPAKVDRGKGMDLLSDVALLEAAQVKEALKKSKKDSHMLYASGLGDGGDSGDDRSNDDDSDDATKNDDEDDVKRHEEEYSFAFNYDKEEYDELYKDVDVKSLDVEQEKERKDDHHGNHDKIYMFMLNMVVTDHAHGLEEWIMVLLCWVLIVINPLNLTTVSFGVDAAMDLEEKHQVFNAAGEDLSAAKQKLMLLDSAAERRLMLLSMIMNGDSLVPTRVVKGVLQPVAPTTAGQRLARKNELKAHAIEKRFGGNTETKKVQKTLLKQQFENFTGSSSEGTASQNLAFVSSSHTDSTTDSVSAVASVSTSCAKLPASPLPNVDSLSFFKRQAEILVLMDLHLWDLICLKWNAKIATEIDILLGSVGIPRIQEGLVQLSHKEGLSQLRPLHPMPWSLSVMVQEVMIGAIKQRKSLQTMLLWLFHHQAHLLIMRFQPSGGYHAVPPLYTGTFMPPKHDLVFNTTPTAIEIDHIAFNVQLSPTTPEHDLSHTTRPIAPIIEDWVSDFEEESETKALQSKPVFHTAVRPVSADMPKLNVTRPRYAHQVVTKSKSPIRRHMTRSPSLTTSNSPPRVIAVKALVVSAAQGMHETWIQVSNGLGPKENLTIQFVCRELNEGYVAFGGNPKGGKITGKGKIKTARTTLLLALPDEHQLRFSKYETAQELWGAILKTFGGNEATKKTKKNQLKQQHGNFKPEGSETLEQTFNRLQAIMSHLEDDLDTMSLDDVYNYLKVYEPEVQKKSKTNSQNIAFISSSNTRSGKGKVHTASVSTVSTASTDVAAASISHDTIDEDDIEEIDIKWNMALLSMRADRECRAPRSQDKGKRESYRQGPNEEEQAPKALIAINGIRWDWSYMANEEENHALVADVEVPTEFALMPKSSLSLKNEVYDDSYCFKSCRKNTENLNTKISKLSKKLSDCETGLYHYKRGLSQVEARLVEFKTQEIKFCEKIIGLERDVEVKINKIKHLMNELEQVKKEKEGLDNKLTGFESALKDLDTLLGS
nr:hypothetical protein [Tanacetum cinerariifolium]